MRADKHGKDSEEEHRDRRCDWSAGERVVHRTFGWIGSVAAAPSTGNVMDVYQVTCRHGRYRQVDVYVCWDHTDAAGYFDAAALYKAGQRQASARPDPH